MNNSLTIRGEFPSPAITLSEEVTTLKANLITSALAIQSVEDEETDKLAMIQVKALADHRIAFEKNRKEIKEPITRLGKEIDDIARNHLAEILIEEARIKGLRDAHASRLAEIQRQKAAKAEAERRRIERERFEAENRANEERRKAENAAAQAEIEALRAENAKIKATTEAARIEAERKEREATERQEAINREAAERAEAARIEDKKRELELAKLAAQAPDRIPAGMREEIDFEITDIAAFAAKYPTMVEITPKRSNILKALKEYCKEQPESTELTGLRIIKNIVAGGKKK
jgi:hypothetical protein